VPAIEKLGAIKGKSWSYSGASCPHQRLMSSSSKRSSKTPANQSLTAQVKGEHPCFLACTPTHTTPLFQYVDPIIAATWSEDGAIHDVCKALSPRFREPNSIVSLSLQSCGVTRQWADNSQVVFKALIVLHMMVRNGATDNVLQYLSSSDVLRLKNVAAGQWEGVLYIILPVPRSLLLHSGYNAPTNLQHYALYLDTRIRTYRDLKHDAIRVQSETNRDMRLSMSLEEDGRLARNHISKTPRERGSLLAPPRGARRSWAVSSGS
jgi:hypothetical protein